MVDRLKCLMGFHAWEFPEMFEGQKRECSRCFKGQFWDIWTGEWW